MVLYSSSAEQINVIGFTKVTVIESDRSKCCLTEVVLEDRVKWAWRLNSTNLSLEAFSVGCCSLRYPPLTCEKLAFLNFTCFFSPMYRLLNRTKEPKER